MGIFKIKDPTTHEWIPEEMYHGAVDSAMSDTSENPVQNKIVKEYIDTNAQSDWEETDTSDPSYIKNKPVIPEPTEQVQSNWNETDTTSKAYIQNKPNIPVPVPQMQSDWEQDDATQVDYIKNKPTIPAETPIATTSVTGKVKPDGTTITVDSSGTISAAASSQVQVDWNQTDTTQVDYIKNKPVIPEPVTQEQSDWNQTDTTAVDYIKNKPSIPTLVQSDWNETDTTDPAYIQNKPTIPEGVTVDTALSMTSENPVQNKVITSAVASVIGAPDDPSATLVNFTTAGSVNPPLTAGSIVLPAMTANDLPIWMEVKLNDYNSVSDLCVGIVVSGSDRYLCLIGKTIAEPNTYISSVKIYDQSGNELGNGNIASRPYGYTSNALMVIAYFKRINNYYRDIKVGSVKHYSGIGDNYRIRIIGTTEQFYQSMFGASLGTSAVVDNNSYRYTWNGTVSKTPWEQIQDRVTALENNPYALPIATTTTLGGIKPDGTTITVDPDTGVASASGGVEQVQADWNQTDNTEVDFIKNKPTIPSNEKLINLENRYNQIFGDNTPPAPPEFPPVKTNYKLPQSVLPIRTGYNTVIPVFTVNSSGTPIYKEVYTNLPEGIDLIGYGLYDRTSYGTAYERLVFILRNTLNVITNVSFKCDTYNAVTGVLQTEGQTFGNCALAFGGNLNGVSISVDRFHDNNGFYFELGANNTYVICPTLNIYTNTCYTGSSGLNTITPHSPNTNWSYTVNADDPTIKTPWEQLNDKVTVLETSKQNTLTAGANITIVDNVISASGGETTPAFKEISVTLVDTDDPNNTITGYLDIWRMGTLGWFNFLPNSVPATQTSKQYKVNIPLANLSPVFSDDDISKQGTQFDRNCFNVPAGLYTIASIFKCYLMKFPNDDYIQLTFEFDSNTSGTGVSTGCRLFNII